MINEAQNLINLAKVGGGAAPAGSSSAGAPASSFSEVLGKSIDEVSRLQQDASKAVEDLATGKSQDVTGVMTAMEKSDLAFKTLLAIRAKLMEAYEELKTISV
jgi:flagellar hook-basal body complex protein FliE